MRLRKASSSLDPVETALVADQARLLAIQTSLDTQTPHISSSLSCIDIITVLVHPSNNNSGNFLLSKGHAALALYSVFCAYGIISRSELASYCQDGSIFEGHVNSQIPQVPLSTGSLGHALPFALGRAMSSELLGKNNQFWVLLSDGELNEGSNWESLMIAGFRASPNLNVIVDRNHLQSLASTEATSGLEPLERKFSAFGWHVIELDGHNHGELISAMALAESNRRPTVIIAETKKGFGVVDIEASPVLYHYKPANESHLRQLVDGSHLA